MREIARRAGVTPMTVSRALNRPDKVAPETRKRIEEIIEEAGFVPDMIASSLSLNRSKIIATVVATLTSSSVAAQMQGITDALAATQYQVLLITSNFPAKSEAETIRRILAWRPAGLIMPAFLRSKDVRREVKLSGIPVVEVYEIEGHAPIETAIGISNFDAAYEMIRNLKDRGYRKIAFVDAAPVENSYRVLRRRGGYLKAVRDFGLPEEPSLIEKGPMGMAFGAQALSRLKARHGDLDAILFSNDLTAIGGIQECHRTGLKIPADIAIAGIDDMDAAAQIYPALTTVRIPLYEVGRRAAELILKRLQGENVNSEIIDLGFEIIQRETT